MFRKVITKLILMTLLSAMILTPDIAKADQYDDYIAAGQHHNVISNSDFVDINSMSAQDIQNFLVAKGSYLKDYVDNSAAGMGRSAAQIIWDASHGKYEAAGSLYGIDINEATGTVNPQVILVFLQKEQSLISTTVWDDWKMLASMGYGCYAGVSGDYNGNNCKDSTEGFTLQVEWGAWQLRYNYEIAGMDEAWWNSHYGGQHYRTGNTITAGTSRTPPDSYQVTLSNQATASCYRYTPYVFFGNYNVWNLYYNTYDFDAFSSEITGTNDTAKFSAQPTYDNSFTFSSTKSSNTRATFNGTVIAEFGTTTWTLSFEPQYGGHNHEVLYVVSGGGIAARKVIYTERHKMADIDGDGFIGIIDLAIFAENWNAPGAFNPMCDLAPDGVVNINDLAIFAENWGR